jgi:hypothetical protein
VKELTRKSSTESIQSSIEEIECSLQCACGWSILNQTAVTGRLKEHLERLINDNATPQSHDYAYTNGTLITHSKDQRPNIPQGDPNT